MRQNNMPIITRAEREYRIEQYLNGAMTDHEEYTFLVQVAVDKELRNDLKARKTVTEAIRKDRESITSEYPAIRSRMLHLLYPNGSLHYSAPDNATATNRTTIGNLRRAGGLLLALLLLITFSGSPFLSGEMSNAIETHSGTEQHANPTSNHSRYGNASRQTQRATSASVNQENSASSSELPTVLNGADSEYSVANGSGTTTQLSDNHHQHAIELSSLAMQSQHAMVSDTSKQSPSFQHNVESGPNKGRPMDFNVEQAVHEEGPIEVGVDLMVHEPKQNQ